MKWVKINLGYRITHYFVNYRGHLVFFLRIVKYRRIKRAGYLAKTQGMQTELRRGNL
jgi:hypothetical protein